MFLKKNSSSYIEFEQLSTSYNFFKSFAKTFVGFKLEMRG